MTEPKALTLRDVQDAGGVTDELLEPFVVGSSDDEKKHSRDTLREAVSAHVRYLDSVDRDVRAGKLDQPIVTAPEKKKSRSTSSKSGKSSSSSNK